MPSHVLHRVLASLKNVRAGEKGWRALCPVHDDHHASLSITQGDDGRVLLKCFAGCSVEEIVTALGMAMRDLFPEPPSSFSTHPEGPRSGTDITVEDLARDKALPLEFLCGLGLKDGPKGVLIPYYAADGSLATRQRLRTALNAREGSFWLRGKGKPVPYGLERLQDSREKGFLILVEGESDSWTLWYHDLPALGIPGSEMYSKVEADHVNGFPKLYVVEEPDRGGAAFISGIARRLKEIGWTGEAFRVRLPDTKDVNDLHCRKPEEFKEAFQKALDAADPLAAGVEPDTARPRETAEKQSQATMLLNLAKQVEVFHDPKGDAYATFRVGDHRETWPVKGGAFRRFLIREFYLAHGKPPNSQALQDSLGVLEARACYDGETRSVFVRVAGEHERIYLDLANAAWEVLEVSPGGWKVLSEPPVRFRRMGGMLPLPNPARGGNLEELRSFVNLPDEKAWNLYLGWLLAALRPRGPFPVLVLGGEHGSAKSTAAKVARTLCDPNAVPLRAEPRDVRDLMIAASNSWCIALDNLSHLPPWLSDALCRLATGGGFGTRELFTDGGEVLFEAQRPVVVNGIEEIATRSDLVDRSLILDLPEIPNKLRRPEELFWPDFEAASPHILGALLEVAATGLRELPTVRLAELPRMADFARWVTACETGLTWPRNAFLRAYADNRENANALALEASPIAALILAVGEYKGTATHLLGELNSRAEDTQLKQAGWPKTPRGLSGILRRLAPNLRAIGTDVRFEREPDSARARIITIRKVSSSTARTVQTVRAPVNKVSGEDTTDAKPPSSDGGFLPVDGEVDGLGPL